MSGWPRKKSGQNINANDYALTSGDAFAAFAANPAPAGGSAKLHQTV